jgi:hypothetical protein
MLKDQHSNQLVINWKIVKEEKKSIIICLNIEDTEIARSLT